MPLAHAWAVDAALPEATAESFAPHPERLRRFDWIALPGDHALRAFTPAIEAPENDICETLSNAAEEHDLPVVFFTRLIWQESRFNPHAVSPAGAQGVAQFMPRVAEEMGLANPFDPVQALPMSARLLSKLHRQFGNWGLAAAAYNGGARRVREWLQKRGKLPKETRDYVRSITGLSAEQWAKPSRASVEFKLPPRVPCRNIAPSETLALAAKIPLPPERPDDDGDGVAVSAAKVTPAMRRERAAEEASERKPWRVQLPEQRSHRAALANFERLRKRHPKALGGHDPIVVGSGKAAGRGAKAKRVQIALETRASAERLCAKIKGAGGECEVQRN